MPGLLSQESEFQERSKQMFELVFEQEEYKIKGGKAEKNSSFKHSKALTAMI